MRKPRSGKVARRQSLSSTLADIIRRRANQGASVYAVATAAGVAPSVLSRFLSGERGLSTETLDRLADSLGLELRETRRGRTTSTSNPSTAPHE